jgi:hypothetical protein
MEGITSPTSGQGRGILGAAVGWWCRVGGCGRGMGWSGKIVGDDDGDEDGDDDDDEDEDEDEDGDGDGDGDEDGNGGGIEGIFDKPAKQSKGSNNCAWDAPPLEEDPSGRGSSCRGERAANA